MSATNVSDGYLLFMRTTLRTVQEYNVTYAVKNNLANRHPRDQHRCRCMDVHAERPATNN